MSVPSHGPDLEHHIWAWTCEKLQFGLNMTIRLVRHRKSVVQRVRTGLPVRLETVQKCARMQSRREV